MLASRARRLHRPGCPRLPNPAARRAQTIPNAGRGCKPRSDHIVHLVCASARACAFPENLPDACRGAGCGRFCRAHRIAVIPLHCGNKNQRRARPTHHLCAAYARLCSTCIRTPKRLEPAVLQVEAHLAPTCINAQARRQFQLPAVRRSQLNPECHSGSGADVQAPSCQCGYQTARVGLPGWYETGALRPMLAGWQPDHHARGRWWWCSSDRRRMRVCRASMQGSQGSARDKPHIPIARAICLASH